MTRRLGAALLVVGLLGACAGSDDAATDEIDLDTDTPTTAPASGGDGSSDTAPSGSAAPGASPTTRRSGTGTRPGASPGGGTAPAPSRADDAAVVAAARSAPGGFARVMLQPQPAARLVLEVLQQPGAEVFVPAVDRLASTLRDVSGKPVDRPAPGRVDTADERHSIAEIRALADQYGRSAQGGGQATLRVLYLRGQFAESDTVLGIAVRGDTVAIFPEVVRSAATPVVRASQIEDAVLMHEAGHALGLVDLARDTGRADRDHPGHSTNRDSVMYWAVESSLVAQLLGGPPPREFDADDRRDLAALRSGA